MSSVRKLKKDIDYLVEEVITDAYLSLYFHPERKDDVVTIIRDAVGLRNSLYEQANNPAEPRNPKLVGKHYAQIRREMFEGVDKLFVRLSEVGK